MSEITDMFATYEPLQQAAKAIIYAVYGDSEAYQKKIWQGHDRLCKLPFEQAKADYPQCFSLPKLMVCEDATYLGDAQRGMIFNIGAGGSVTLKFTIGKYPVCCGVLMFYNFHINDGGKITDKMLDDLFNAILTIGKRWAWGMYTNNRRLNVIMVQVGGFVLNNDGTYSAGNNPVVAHNRLFKYFHTKKVQTRLMYNKNSRNLLHDMEVVL